MEWNGMEWQSNSDLSIFHLKLKNRGGKKKVGRLVAVNPSRVGILMLACSSSHALFSMLAGLRLGSEGEGKKKKGYVEKEREREKKESESKPGSSLRSSSLYIQRLLCVCFFPSFQGALISIDSENKRKGYKPDDSSAHSSFFFPCSLLAFSFETSTYKRGWSIDR